MREHPIVNTYFDTMENGLSKIICHINDLSGRNGKVDFSNNENC